LQTKNLKAKIHISVLFMASNYAYAARRKNQSQDPSHFCTTVLAAPGPWPRGSIQGSALKMYFAPLLNLNTWLRAWVTRQQCEKESNSIPSKTGFVKLAKIYLGSAGVRWPFWQGVHCDGWIGGVRWSFLSGMRCSWRHVITFYSYFQTDL